MKNATVFLGSLCLFLSFTACNPESPKPSATENSTISKNIHKLFSENKFDEVMALAADNIQVVNYATGQTFNGKESFRDFIMGFKTAFPNLVIKHTNVFESGDQVTLEFEAEGTHTGPLVGPAGTIPPTGKMVKLTVCEIHRIENGKVASIRNYQDSGSLMRQLGLMN
ncbi:MAG: ester cyclase [Saprospiraceae bacterium]